MFRPLRRLLRRWSFPLVGWLSAAIYLVVASGVPLPLPQAATKDRTVAFSCMDRPCGCRTAKQCWANCCCHTRAARLTWARQHGVTPPDTLLADVEMELVKSDAATCATKPSRKSCCSAKLARTAGRPTCNAAKSEAQPNNSQPNRSSHEGNSESVLGIHAFECHGFGTDWLAALVAVPPTIAMCDYRPLPVDFVVAPVLDLSSSALPPPIPPPRTSLS